ncbi:glycosyltransferase [Desulfonatronum sp. SC1]|uniref:glycosyltransferase n=1 Tax=Desulfonatronum sp. SC1 TaxID=2109626 RepID=UPI000D2F68AA|nr:glycosyltransferase [Desulfonatronum sp. SC1]PTN36093.1 glycosyl transferase family 1 [Desulfonatronum sp. SC1]
MHVHHHTTLQSQGGTAQFAHNLMAWLARHDVTGSHTYEIQDNASTGQCLSPFAVAEHVRNPGNLADDTAIVHLHGSADWPTCLDGFAATSHRLVLTLHDCRLLTGGCAYPLHCGAWKTGCQQDCPQNLAAHADHSRAVFRLLETLRPLLISPSAWLSRMVREIHPQARIHTIPNAVPESLGPPASKSSEEKRIVKRELGIDAAGKVVLFVAHGGKQAMYKGGHLWERLWKRVKQGEPRAVAVAVGGNAIHRSGDFLELPYLDQERLLRCMDAADVLVYPSLADNHPLIILEAMCRGLPCAAFASGGIPEQVIHEQSGLLSPPGDMVSLAASVLEILGNPRLGRQLAQAGRDRFIRLFQMDHMGRRHLRLYAESPLSRPDRAASRSSNVG